MSTGKVGGGGSAPRPAAPPPKPASSSAPKSSTSTVKPAASSTSTAAGTGSSSTSSSATGLSSTSTTDTSKSTDTSSTSSASKDEDKSSDSSSSTSTEDKFEKSKESKTEGGKKTKETFNDRFIKSLRQNYEPESSDVKDKVGQVEQALSKDNYSAADGKEAIGKLKSTAADMKSGSRKDKLEARVAELRKEVAEREISQDKVKAAEARDAKEASKAGFQKENGQKDREVGGVEGDVKSDLKDERRRLSQPKEGEQNSRPAANNKNVARAGDNDPETEQIAKQRQLEEAENEARQRLSNHRENNNEEALSHVQRAYDTALANRDQTIQSLQQELSNYYPADKASELAQQSMANKENFYSSFGSLYSLGDKNTQEGLSKLNPDAAKLFAQSNSVSPGDPEEQLGQMRESMQNRAVGATGETAEAVPERTVDRLEGSVADMADIRESELRGRVRDLKAASEAKEQKTEGVGEQSEDKARRLKEEENKLGGSAATKESPKESAEIQKDVKADEKVAPKDGKSFKAVTTEAKDGIKAGLDVAAKDEKNVKAVDAETQKDVKADEKVAPKDDKSFKAVTTEAKDDDVKADQEIALKSEQRASDRPKQIQSAYDIAMADRTKHVQGFEKELSGFYPAEKANELAREAVSSKEDYYAHYGGLHSVGDQSTRDNLAKLNPAAAKLFPSEPKAVRTKKQAGFDPSQKLALNRKPDKSSDSQAAGAVPRQSKMSPQGEAEPLQSKKFEKTLAALGQSSELSRQENQRPELTDEGKPAPIKGQIDEAIQKKLIAQNLIDSAGASGELEKSKEKDAFAKEKDAFAKKKAAIAKKKSGKVDTGEKLKDTEQTHQIEPVNAEGAAAAGAIGKALGGAVAEGTKMVSKAVGSFFGEKGESGAAGSMGALGEAGAAGESGSIKKKGAVGETGAEARAAKKEDPEGTREAVETEAPGRAEENGEAENTEELTDGQRRLTASREEARTRLEEYAQNNDTEALRSIDDAYARAEQNPEETKRALERELAKVYPEEEAKEMAAKALESKEDFYSQYSSLQRNAADDESKAALENVNPEAAALAAREQQQALPDAASQTIDEQVTTVSTAIQDSFKESYKNDPQKFEEQLREAYPDAEDEKIQDLMRLAEEGNFPVPENIKFVPGDDESLGSQSSNYDADNQQLVLSEELKHNPAALRKAMLDGTAANLDERMGVDKGVLAAFNLSGEKDKFGAKLISQVQDDVAARSNTEAVARTRAYEAATADPETRQRTQEVLRDELEKRLQETGSSERRIQREAWRGARNAMEDADSFDSVFNHLYEKGDSATRDRLKELNPGMAALVESRLNAPKEEEGINVQETAAATLYERYRDAKSDGPHLDPISEVAKGFERATKDDGKPTMDALQRIYEARDLPPERALEKAQEALSSEKGFYSQYTALWKTADEAGKEQLRELNPEMAALMDREKAGTLKTDDQWRQDVRDSHTTPFVGGWLANNAINKVEAKLTTTSQSDEQRNLASTFQGAIKERATQDPEKFAQDLRTAFPKAEQETIDGLVQLAKDGNFPLAQKVSFVDKDDPLLNGEDASYDSQSQNIYIDKELLNDPAKVLAAYVEENGHHLDSVLGGGDSEGDEGELLEQSLRSGGINFLEQSKAKLEDDFSLVIGDDGVARFIENRATSGPVSPNPGPVTPGPVTPGPVTPGPVTPGPVTPGPVTPGPLTPGIPTSGPISPTPRPATPSPSPVNPEPVTPKSSPVTRPISERPSPTVSPRSPDPVSPRSSPDSWKPPAEVKTPEPPQQNQETREAREAREANKQNEFKANFDPRDIRNLDELKHFDDAMSKLKDLPGALDQLDKLKEALKGGKGLTQSLGDLKNLTKTMENLKGLADSLGSFERLGNLQHQLKDLPGKLANMETLPSALETLGNLNKSMSDLQKLPKMLEQLRDLPRQMSQLEQLPNTLNRFNKLPDNFNDLGKLSSFLDSVRGIPGEQIKTNGARAVAAERVLSGKIVGSKPVKGAKTGPRVPGSSQVAAPSGTETGGKASRIAGGGSTVPYVGRLGGTAPGLGPSIGRDASRQTQPRPGSSGVSKAVSKAAGLGRAGGVAGTGKGLPGTGSGGPKTGFPSGGPKTGIPTGGPKTGIPSGGPKTGIPTGGPKTGIPTGGPKTNIPNTKTKGPVSGTGAAPRAGMASPGTTFAKPGSSIAKSNLGPRLGGVPGVGTPRPIGKPGAGISIGTRPSGSLGAHAPAAKAAPSPIPAAEYQQLSQRLNAVGSHPEGHSLSRLQSVLTGSDGTREIPSVLKSLENLPKSMSSVGRLNGLLGKKEGLAKGISGLRGLAEMAKSSSASMKSLDGLSSLLSSVQDSPDAYSGLKRMPGLINHMGGIKGDNNPEAMSRLLKTVQNRPDALEGLKTFQNLMSTLQKPEMARSLEQLGKMVQSGQLEKVAQSGQKLAIDLQKPQAVFGMDKLESMFFKAKTNPEAMKGLDRLGQMLGGRDGQGAAIGVERLGSLLQTVKSQPNMMRQIVERVAQPSQGQTASTAQPAGKAATGSPGGQGMAPAGFEGGAAVANRRGVDRRGGDRRANDRRIGAAGRVGATSNAASAGATGGAKGSSRLRDYRQIFNMLSEVGQGAPGATDHPAKLAEMSRGTQGAHAVADAMEAQVVAKPERMLETLNGMTKSSESRQAFGKTLSNMAEATPDRLVGILLLTSDVAGGQQAMANMFGQLAADPASSGSLGKMIGASTRTETGAAGMKDLLTNMMAQDADGDHTRATKTARTFADASRTKAGARGLAEGLTNLTTLSGGAREVGGMVRQMSRTNEGARATSELLMNLASDRQGAKDLGKVLARASKSTAGGRDLLASFAKMAQTDAGKNDVSRLMVRLTESQHGAKMLSHMARDTGNAKSLAGLLNQVAESPQAAARMNFALERALHNPQARTEMEVFRGRMTSDIGLREAVERLTQAPTQSQPLQQLQSVKGADAMARLTAFENLARAIGERPVESPISTVEAAPKSSSGGTSDGSQNSGQQQNPENRPFPNQTQPYPDLAVVSDVWRNQSLKPEGGERLAEQAQGAAAAEAEESRSSDDRKSAFRPGDVYSDLTLLRARICGDCGFRTNAMGKCGRCGFNLLQEQPYIGPT